jgi:hypothetical protein
MKTTFKKALNFEILSARTWRDTIQDGMTKEHPNFPHRPASKIWERPKPTPIRNLLAEAWNAAWARIKFIGWLLLELGGWCWWW